MKMKLKLVRVVTASYVVPWHLGNTLSRISPDFETCVVGQNVSENRSFYPDIEFFDININRKSSYISDIIALLVLCRLFLINRPDIVHSIMPKAGLLSAIAGFVCGVPIRIHTFTGQTWVGKTGIPEHFYRMLDRLINKLNTVCLTDSFSQSEFLGQHNIFQQGRPLPVLLGGSLSGVDLARFQLDTLKEAARQLRLDFGMAEDDFVFSFVARKTQEKGAIDVLKAFSRVRLLEPSAKLLYVGPDEDGLSSRLRATNAEFFLGVSEVGSVTNHETYLAATDVLCLPSYKEGFGSIVIDAAAMGIPSIGSRIPGLIDAIVDGQTGLLCPAGDIDEFVKAMVRLINDRRLREIMGTRARQRVDELFTADKLYAALKDFYLLTASKVDRAHASSKTG